MLTDWLVFLTARCCEAYSQLPSKGPRAKGSARADASFPDCPPLQARPDRTVRLCA